MKKEPGFHLGDVEAQAAQVLKVWKANRDFRMKDATYQDFEATHGGFKRVLKDIEAKNRELGVLRKARDKAESELSNLCTRARSGVRGYFGPDSSQYEQVGGTPTSKRKKAVLKARPAAALPGESTGTEQ